MVKIDVEAVGRMLPSRGYIYGMPTFTLAGATYDYLAPSLEGDPEDTHSWEYGKWPKAGGAAEPLELLARAYSTVAGPDRVRATCPTERKRHQAPTAYASSM